MRFVRSLRGLSDFIATVILGAPDRFRYRDHRSADDQLTLDRAFDELRAGLEFVPQRFNDPTLFTRLHGMLDASLSAYRIGDRKQGAHRLQDFQDLIFGVTEGQSDAGDPHTHD
jgi:hypothetical protein